MIYLASFSFESRTADEMILSISDRSASPGKLVETGNRVFTFRWIKKESVTCQVAAGPAEAGHSYSYDSAIWFRGDPATGSHRRAIAS